MAPRLLPLAVAAALLAAPASADDPTRRGFDADPARFALSMDGGFSLETAAVPEPGRFRLAALLQHADGLLVLEQGGRRHDLLESRTSLHLLGAYGLGRVELSAALPIALHQASDLSFLTGQGVTGPLVDPVASAALGDFRLGAKARLLEGLVPVDLAGLVELRLPTGDRRAFAGDGLSLAPSLVATRALGRIRLDGQLGYLIRGPGQYAQLVVHDGVTWGLGGSYELPPLRRLERWKALAELTGGIPRGWDGRSDRYRAPLAARAGLRALLTDEVSVELGAGTGLGPVGYGHERWRVFLGVRWGRLPVGPPEEDADHDGVPNLRDQCPTVPGPAELDGCPDADGDEIPDREDRCPRQPGPAANEGCPVAEEEPLVELETERLALNDAIHFDTGKDTIKPESFKVLDQVAALLLEHPELAQVRVEGHTDNVGGAAYNKDLSARRAASVVRYLVAKGVPAGRLAPAGFGFERPVASNGTALGRARNRRVEFNLLNEEGGR